MCVCVCHRTADWAASPGTAEPRCFSIENTKSVYKHGGTGRQMGRDRYQRAHLLHTCSPHSLYGRASKWTHAKLPKHTFPPTCGTKADRARPISDFGTFCSSLPDDSPTLRTARRGISRDRGGCDSQRNPLSLALPRTSQSTGELLIHRTAQSG